MASDPKIIYTITDEAPFLATFSFLPIVKFFTRPAGVEVLTKDISLAGRIIANFPENLTDDQKIPDALSELGELAKKPEANIIKLPNISASIPQLKAAIKELQAKGFKLPDYPEDPKTSEEEDNKKRYGKVLGSAVNPVLREGNSDRRVAGPVKEYAKANPHSMGEWSKNSGTHVASMESGDFYGSEKSVFMQKEDTVSIVLKTANGTQTLKDGLALLKDELIDSSVMSSKKLNAFFKKEIEDAKSKDLLLSLHMKATMMKVSDPIIFGECVKQYYAPVFEKYSAEFEEIGVDARNGIQDVYNKISKLDATKQEEIKKALEDCYTTGPDLAMVNSDKGITNLHVPNDVIIDASMPAAIRSSGQMWNKEGKLQDTKALIPDRSYAGVYQETIQFCKENGAFDPATMGNVSNVGLMAKKAEEYGSHDKTFWIEEAGTVQVLDSSNTVLMEQTVEPGDIFRMCQTKDVAVKDWVKLGVNRSRATGSPAVFWLDKNRAHDANLIQKVELYLKDHDISGLDIKILSPVEAVKFSLERLKKGEDTISVTGNVLRDYLTDLFPILELGTSAKMLSIVPLLAGGGLYETGAGGSAPKHVDQFVGENHLRWDSLGEFLALSVSIEDWAEKTKNEKAKTIASCLEAANSRFLKENKSPSRKVNELDNRGSHFYLALFWAEALAAQKENQELKDYFSPIAEKLRSNESKIVEELNNVQGVKVDIEGYYFPNKAKVSAAMRPSQTLNSIVD